MPLLGVHLREGASEKPTAAGDHDAHGVFDAEARFVVCTIMNLSPSFSISCGAPMRQWVRGAIGLTFLSVAAAAQEPTLPVPPNVVAEGVPPIPMSVVEAVSPYGQFRRARLLAWHPAE